MYVNVVVCGACCEYSERLKTVRVSVAWAWYREWARWYWKLGSFFCVIYSQFSRSMGSLGHCWVIGASVATKKKHESGLPKQTKSKSGANTVYARSNRTRIVESHETYQPGTSSGSSQLPEPSLSPILKTVPMGQPYSRATPSRQM